MTKPRFLFWTLGLVAIFLIAACAPASTPAPAGAPPVAGAPTSAPATLTMTVVPSTISASETPTQQPAPASATSRGDALEATDPTTVRLDSGQLQLVEFFRFT